MPTPNYTRLTKSFRIAKPLCDESLKLPLWQNTVAAVADTLAELDSEFKRLPFLINCKYYKD